jgi:hypothetical protein
MLLRNQRDHLRLAHAWWSPQHDRGVLAMLGSLEFSFEYGE